MTLNFVGKGTFGNNLTVLSGGGIKTFLSALSFTGSTSFTNNSGVHGGEIHKLHSTLNIARKSIPGNGGGIKAMNSTLDFTGNITFVLVEELMFQKAA